MRQGGSVESDSVVNDRGVRIYVDGRDDRGRQLRETSGNVNPGSLVLWQLALDLHEWDGVVDVGVNYGEMIVGVEIPRSARIIGLEPNDAVLPHLRRTLAEFDRDVELLEVAASDRPGTASFLVDVEWSGMSGLAASAVETGHATRIVEVPVTTIDAVAGARGFTSLCLKIDVEGGELAVLDGASVTLSTVDRWVAMIEILHLSDDVVARLCREYSMFLLDRRRGALVPFPARDEGEVSAYLTSGWLYPQDALVLSPGIVQSLSGPAAGRPDGADGGWAARQLVDAVLERERRIGALEHDLAAIRASRSWRWTQALGRALRGR